METAFRFPPHYLFILKVQRKYRFRHHDAFGASQRLETPSVFRCSAQTPRRNAADFLSGRRGKEDPAEDAAILRSRNDDRVEAEPAAVAMKREDQHQHEKKEIGPRPLAGGTVEAKPQIDDLQRADHARVIGA